MKQLLIKCALLVPPISSLETCRHPNVIAATLAPTVLTRRLNQSREGWCRSNRQQTWVVAQGQIAGSLQILSARRFLWRPQGPKTAADGEGGAQTSLATRLHRRPCHRQAAGPDRRAAHPGKPDQCRQTQVQVLTTEKPPTIACTLPGFYLRLYFIIQPCCVCFGDGEA